MVAAGAHGRVPRSSPFDAGGQGALQLTFEHSARLGTHDVGTEHTPLAALAIEAEGGDGPLDRGRPRRRPAEVVRACRHGGEDVFSVRTARGGVLRVQGDEYPGRLRETPWPRTRGRRAPERLPLPPGPGGPDGDLAGSRQGRARPRAPRRRPRSRSPCREPARSPSRPPGPGGSGRRCGCSTARPRPRCLRGSPGSRRPDPQDSAARGANETASPPVTTNCSARAASRPAAVRGPSPPSASASARRMCSVPT